MWYHYSLRMASLVNFVYEGILACSVWTTVVVLSLLVVVLVLGIFMYALFWWLIRLAICLGKSDHKWLSKENFEEARKNYFEESFPKETTIQWHNIVVALPQVSPNITVELSVVYCPCVAATATQNNQEPRSLVVLHGVGSSATLLISSSLAALREKYHVYVVDIPGFGTSDTSSRLDHLSPDVCLDFYAQCLDQLMALLNLNKPIIVAHSVGAFLVMNSMSRWSTDRIGGVVLVSPAGILPTLSELGAYWALLFYAGIPMSLFRFFGTTVGSFLFLPVLSNPQCLRTSYWLQVQSSMTMVNIPAKFISLGFASSHWNRPQLNNLLQSDLSYGMVWGDKDDLMPIATGRLLVQLGEKLGKRFVLEPVAGAGHSPFHVNGGADFAAALNKVVTAITADGRTGQAQNTSVTLGSATTKVGAGESSVATHADSVHTGSVGVDVGAALVPGNCIVEMRDGQWCSSFSTSNTRRRIEELHRHIEQSVDEYVRTKHQPAE